MLGQVKGIVATIVLVLRRMVRRLSTALASLLARICPGRLANPVTPSTYDTALFQMLFADLSNISPETDPNQFVSHLPDLITMIISNTSSVNALTNDIPGSLLQRSSLLSSNATVLEATVLLPTLQTAIADISGHICQKDLQRLRNELYQLLGQMEHLIDALTGLADGWQPAAVLHAVGVTPSSVRNHVVQFFFCYFTDNVESVAKLLDELRKKIDYYRSWLAGISIVPEPYDERCRLLEHGRRDLEQELHPETLNRKLKADVVPVFALAKRFDDAEAFGQAWLRQKASLSTRHNLALAYLDWGEKCVRMRKRDAALERWWDAVEHWAPLFACDDPAIAQHWRQWAPDNYKPVASAMTDAELAAVVGEVQERVFGLLALPPWEAFGFEKADAAHWLYDCLLRLFRVHPGNYQELASVAELPLPAAQETQEALVREWEMVADLGDMAWDHLKGLVHSLMIWEDKERERQQHGTQLLLHIEYPLKRVKERHFSRLSLPSDARTARACCTLQKLLCDYFLTEELLALCDDLGINPQNIHQDVRYRASHDLVRHCQLLGRVDQLASRVVQLRPNVAGDLTQWM